MSLRSSSYLARPSESALQQDEWFNLIEPNIKIYMLRERERERTDLSFIEAIVVEARSKVSKKVIIIIIIRDPRHYVIAVNKP